jgi:hypothetical protein
LRNDSFKQFIVELNGPVISASVERLHLKNAASDHMLILFKYFENKKGLLVVDEYEIKRKKYVNIFAGSINEPNKIFCIACTELIISINSTTMGRLIFDALETININLSNLVMIIFDAASYMIKTVKNIKESIPHISRVKYMAH